MHCRPLNALRDIEKTVHFRDAKTGVSGCQSNESTPLNVDKMSMYRRNLRGYEEYAYPHFWSGGTVSPPFWAYDRKK